MKRKIMGMGSLIFNVICVSKVRKEMKYWYVMAVNCMPVMKDAILD
jgi:hypothetical protein